MQDDLLISLEHARWSVAFRTFGNDHATLIGLLVDWWITSAPTRWALESGPSFGHLPKGKGGGMCDAILGEGDRSRGIVEVEGDRHDYTLSKIGRFFASEMIDLQSLEFAVFLAYTWTLQGRGQSRGFPPLPLEHFIDLGKAVTKENPGKRLAILVLDKQWERLHTGPRARNEWYMGRPTEIRGALLLNGEVTARHSLIARAC